MDQFTVVDQLGAGAFGRALLCRDKSTREFVVIKEIRCVDKNARDEARREAELLRKHSHPNVCRLIASFSSDEQKRFYLVLEHCDGGDLSQAISKRRSERRPYPEHEAASIFVMITLALRHVHARRIVHRDVKAANVFLTKKGVAKLGDFGVSRQLDVSGGGATQLASTRIGTPYYLAPEIFEGKPYGRSADVWSLGVLFYEILVLRMPFEANSLAALCVKITQSRAPNVIGYSADCAELVASLLHKDASQRPLTDALVKDAYVRKHMPSAVAAARSTRINANDTTRDDTTDEESDTSVVITKRVEDMLPAGLGAEYARCRAEALRNRRHQEGDPAEAPSPRRTTERRKQAAAFQQADAARQKELQQAASQQYRENRRFRAARVREERERIVSGGCADDVVEETAQNYQTKLADQYRENRAKARSYERRARDDLQGPCVDLRGAARGAANLEKRMREKREKEAHDRDLRDALAEEAARYQAEARHAKQAVALDFTEAPRRKPPRRLARQACPPPEEEGAD